MSVNSGQLIWICVIVSSGPFKWVNWMMQDKPVASYRVGYVIWTTLTHIIQQCDYFAKSTSPPAPPACHMEWCDGVVIIKCSLPGSCCNTTHITQQVIPIKVITLNRNEELFSSQGDRWLEECSQLSEPFVWGPPSLLALVKQQEQDLFKETPGLPLCTADFVFIKKHLNPQMRPL